MPIDDFVDRMSELPQLRCGASKDAIEKLLYALYELASQKVYYDLEIEDWPRALPKVRKARKSMSSIKRVIDQANHRFASILVEKPIELQYLDTLSEAHQKPLFSETMREIVRLLSRLLEGASLVEAIIATNVHPAKRTKEETRLIDAHDLSARHEEEYDKFLQPKTRDVDHWFIGVVAERLEGFEKAFGIRLTAKQRIIGRLFEAIGESGRTEDSISKELQRQKSDGRPRLRVPASPKDDEYGPDLLP